MDIRLNMYLQRKYMCICSAERVIIVFDKCWPSRREE